MNNAIDQALEEIRKANPVPDPVGLADAMIRSDVFLTTTKETSMSIDTDQPNRHNRAGRRSGKRRNLLALVGVFAVAIVAVAAVVTVTTDESAAPASGSDDPAAVIEQYVAAFNSGDIEAVMALYTEDSVNLDRDPTDPVVAGLRALRIVEAYEISWSASADALSISNVEVNGDTVTWDHRFVNRDGDGYCMEGHSAVIDDGKILTWTWPGGHTPCT